METAINLQAVFVTDIASIAILIVLLISRGWILPARKDESHIMLIMLSVSILNCIADMLAFAFDGKPGSAFYFFLIICNSFLYLCFDKFIVL